MEKRTIAAILGEYLSALKYEDLPADVIELAKTRVLNALAVSIPGRDMPAGVVAWESVRKNKGPCSIIGRPEKVPAADAALANGVMGHALLQEDVGAGGHPSVVVVPAALAVGEEVGATGQQVITAILAGYEAGGCASRGMILNLIKKGFRGVSVIGGIAAAATAAKLLDLNAEQTAHALGFAASLASGLYQSMHEGTMDTYFQMGFASRNGVTVAHIAQNGGIASSLAFEGAHGLFQTYSGSADKASEVVKSLGGEFAIRDVMSKPYATSHGNHDAIDLAVSLREKVNDARDIRFIILKVIATTKQVPGKDGVPPYHNMLMAQMSLRFCVAAAFLGKPVNSYKYFRDHYDAPDVCDLANRTQVIGEEGRRVTALEVHFQDGRSISIEEDRSHKWRPHTDDLKVMFRNMAGSFLGSPGTAEVMDIIMTLDKVKDIHDLTARISG